MKMTYEEFKATLLTKFGKVSFREHGQHGWTDISQFPKVTQGNPGPHWVDAAPVPRTQHLLGSYDFNTGEATFF